jgi:rhodanese-related sulfurtransferase
MLRDALWMITAVALTTFLSFGAPASACFGGTQVKEMHAEAVADALAKKQAVHIYDANSKERYDQGHVPTARWVPFNGVAVSHLPKDKSATLIFYCYNEMCSASTTAAKRALELGFTNVYVMPEGIEGWIESGQATEAPSSRS